MKIGIDLGTCYSSVAAEVDGKIVLIRVATGASAFGDSFSMPTAVYYDNGRLLLGQAALGKRKLEPSCFKDEFKRELGTFTPFILGGEEYLPEQLYTEFFLYFKNQAIEQTGEKIERTYITHPANYGNSKKRLIEKAANNAGLFDVVLVDEPTAAAAGYSQKSRVLDGDILLVYDLGGGTFDVAIIKKTPNGYVHLSEPLGISKCGGVDFDRIIFDDIMEKLNQNGKFDTERLLKEKRFTAALSETSIQIKHQLSQAESHTEPIAAGNFDYFDYKITREHFEDLIYPFVVNTCEKVKDILKNSGLVSSDVDRVVLVGGSSRIPIVKKMVQDTLKKDIHMDADPELAVCQGALSIGMKLRKEDISGVDETRGRNIQTSHDELHESEKEVLDFSDVDFKARLVQVYPNSSNFLDGKKPQAEADEFSMYPECIRKLMVSVKLGTYSSDSNWIYYSGRDVLIKINMDGTEKNILSYNNVWVSPIKIDEEWVYYLVNEGSFLNSGLFLYRIRKNGTEEARISREKVHNYFTVYGEWIYFNTETDLKMMRTDGTAVRTLDHEKYTGIIAVDKWIYCINTVGVYRINAAGMSKTNIIKGSIGNIAIYGDWIFYSDNDSSKSIYKIRTDGTGKCKICDDKAGKINICDSRLYYRNLDDEKCYRISLDGIDRDVVM